MRRRRPARRVRGRRCRRTGRARRLPPRAGRRAGGAARGRGRTTCPPRACPAARPARRGTRTREAHRPRPRPSRAHGRSATGERSRAAHVDAVPEGGPGDRHGKGQVAGASGGLAREHVVERHPHRVAGGTEPARAGCSPRGCRRVVHGHVAEVARGRDPVEQRMQGDGPDILVLGVGPGPQEPPARVPLPPTEGGDLPARARAPPRQRLVRLPCLEQGREGVQRGEVQLVHGDACPQRHDRLGQLPRGGGPAARPRAGLLPPRRGGNNPDIPHFEISREGTRKYWIYTIKEK